MKNTTDIFQAKQDMHGFFGHCVWRYVLWNSMYIVPYTAL